MTDESEGQTKRSGFRQHEGVIVQIMFSPKKLLFCERFAETECWSRVRIRLRDRRIDTSYRYKFDNRVWFSPDHCSPDTAIIKSIVAKRIF